MNFIRAIFKWIDRITAWIAVLSLVLMFFFVFLNVVTRYILGTGFAWSEEGARYAMLAVIILGVLEVTHQRDHFAVDLYQCCSQTCPPLDEYFCGHHDVSHHVCYDVRELSNGGP